jgi:hypothetical protein
MTNRINFFLVALVTICSQFSCIKEVKKQPKFEGAKLVLNGFICPDSLLRVHVSLSHALEQVSPVISAAQIELYEDGVLLGGFQYQGNGWYLNTVYPDVDKEYQIMVSVAGYPSVSAKTRITALPQNLAGTYYKTAVVPIEDASGTMTFPTETKIEFDDAAQQVNYYEFGSNSFLYETSQETDPSLLTDGDLSYNPSTYYCSDLLFNGNHKILLLQKGGNVFLNFGIIFFDANYKRLFKSCSPEYYQFRKSWTKHLYNQQTNDPLDDPVNLLFFGDPVVLYSNVTGGYGVFGGYSVIQLPIQYVE